MPAWCDVVVCDVDDRVALEAKALFFVPSALIICNRKGLTIAGLSATARAAKMVNRDLHYAGRSAISKVMGCEPVVRKSALGFINSANAALSAIKDDHRFSTDDIIACVFRLRDGTEVLEALGLSAVDVSSNCAIRHEIVEAALARYRIQYADARKIWEYCCSVKVREKISSEEIDSIITDDEGSFIKTDTRFGLPMAIKRIENDGQVEYVYRREHLEKAPSSGHEWSIE
ncbi:MAG: hypothetical protein GKS00_06900 [Alphaproteobacteria bacterium]|nr:hypothetical protein [Alphaproteobacteria bacterium]